MSLVLHGVAVGRGIAVGRVHVLQPAMGLVRFVSVSEDDLDDEIALFRQAVSATKQEFEQLRRKIPEKAPAELGAFISVHQMLLADPMLVDEPIRLIRKYQCSAGWALKVQVDTILSQFDQIQDRYLRERRQDIWQIAERILRHLHGRSFNPDRLAFKEPTILIAHDLSPADMMIFKESNCAGFATDVGGVSSHTAILARSLDIPSVIALNVLFQLAKPGEQIIIDGQQGVVLLDPSEYVLSEYTRRHQQWLVDREKRRTLRGAKVLTRDGQKVSLLANIELPVDIEDVKHVKADGIGLFRSEFLFLGRDHLPSEDEQFRAYRYVLEAMKHKPVTIRTVDLSSDKNPYWQRRATADNPALGLTGIRLCLSEPSLFRTQLRALLRAAAYGYLRILFPMIQSLDELQQVLYHVNLARQSLIEEGYTVKQDIPLGMMIEIPAAALLIEPFLEYVDFVAIGTNDLIQYTLAVDRNDDSVAHLYQPQHPAVLLLIEKVVTHALNVGKSVSMCGEMAGDLRFTRTLLELGLREFSMHPNGILDIKERIRSIDLSCRPSDHSGGLL